MKSMERVAILAAFSVI